jgi:hypothetical protein
MKRQVISVLSVALLFAASLPAAAAPHTGMAKQFAFREAMRKLWEDHVVWTRQFVVSAVADLPDKGAAAERLLRNQTDIGNAIKPFYGEAAGERRASLLKEHITIAAELVTAAKAGHKAAADDATRRWNANADEIAAYEKIHAQILHMADMLSAGIISQFPEKFA